MATNQLNGAIMRAEDRGTLPVLADIDMYSEWGGMTAAREAVARVEAQGKPAMIVKDWQRERLYVKPLVLPEVPAVMAGMAGVADFTDRLLRIPCLVARFAAVGELDDIGGRVLWVSRLSDGTVAGVLGTGEGEAPFVADAMDFAEAAGWAQKARVRLTGRVVNIGGLVVLDLRRRALCGPDVARAVTRFEVATARIAELSAVDAQHLSGADFNALGDAQDVVKASREFLAGAGLLYLVEGGV